MRRFLLVYTLVAGLVLIAVGARTPVVAAGDAPTAAELLKLAEEKASSSTNNNATTKSYKTLDDYQQERWMAKLNNIALWIILGTPILLGLVFWAMRLGGPPPAELVMLSAALVLVIQATLVVSLTAEGSDTLSASTGILGAIAGYLFGRSHDRSVAEPRQRSSRTKEHVEEAT